MKMNVNTKTLEKIIDELEGQSLMTGVVTIAMILDLLCSQQDKANEGEIIDLARHMRHTINTNDND